MSSEIINLWNILKNTVDSYSKIAAENILENIKIIVKYKFNFVLEWEKCL